MKKIIKIFTASCILCTGACSSDTEKNNKSIIADTAQTYRPLYHFTTDSNWINDPNGLVYFNGKYHLFAQYNPFGNVWGHMSWAHAVSNDLFTWNEWPLALPEIKNADSTSTMIFSGSAVVDSFNTSGFGKDGQIPLVAIYTSQHDKNGIGIGQNQSLSYSLDEGKIWQQYANNPVLDIKLKDFRDPKVFWFASKKKWLMIVSKPLEYKVQFYESKNLKDWNLLSEFGNMGNIDKVWECPDFIELPVDGTNEKKWVLTVSTGHPQKGYLAMQYFTGNFDDEKFTVDANPYPLYVDFGRDYYAGVTYNNIPFPDGRVIMIGWANCWNYANDIPTKGFRGMYAVPRTLALKRLPQGLRLMQEPVAEIKKFEEELFKSKSTRLNNSTKQLEEASGAALDISFSLQANAGSTAGINILKSSDEETTISYSADTKTITLDRSHSGNTSFNNSFAGADSVKILSASNTVQIRILIDKSIVELFVNDGVYTITDLVFPKYAASNAVELFSKNGTALFTNILINKVNKTMH